MLRQAVSITRTRLPGLSGEDTVYEVPKTLQEGIIVLFC